ncbi:MAG: hypothetical protein B7X47_08430 [Ferrovum sp. 34-44-207]|nr:MAG: hypothetical protein B7X47_08430 [Ferrovum sp. 34-44-207]
MKRFFSWVVFLVLFLFIGLSYSLFIPLQLTVENSIYELKSGYSLRTIAKDLAQKKIIREPYSFILMGKLLGIQSHIKAGSYEFRNGMSAYELLTKIAHGDAIDYEVKIIDGMNFSQLKKELAQNPNLSHQMDHLTTEEVLQQLAGNNSSLEGLSKGYFIRIPIFLIVVIRIYKFLNAQKTIWILICVNSGKIGSKIRSSILPMRH